VTAVKLFLAFILFLSMSGCSLVETIPTPEYIIQRPIGTSSVKIGMTKDEVREIWGKPYQINFVEDKEKWGGAREEWVYGAFTSGIPIDAGYLTRGQKLYFDGESLTNMVEAKEEKKEKEE